MRLTNDGARRQWTPVARATAAFSFWLAWKVTTRRAVIGISSPVFGLRPGPLRLVAQLEVAEARTA